MMMQRTLFALLLLAGSAGAAAANDGIAAYGLGGVEMAQSRSIEMLSEDLRISADEIRVRYEFRNTDKVDITSLVAFPLPPFSGETRFDFLAPVEEAANYVGFTVSVDGKAVEPKVQTRATVSGVDVTALLADLDIPLTLPGEGLNAAISALPEERWQKLAASGAVSAYPPDHLLEALWSIETLFYWTQTFPAGKTVTVEHSYKPIKGHFYLYGSDYLQQADDPQGWPRYFCIEGATADAVRAAMQAGGDDMPPIATTVDYVLMTAHTWAGPIGSFHLEIDTGAPGALVSLCQDGLGDGLKAVGPTTWAIDLKDWLPARDLAIFMLPPAAN